jgi:hypothetical protein
MRHTKFLKAKETKPTRWHPLGCEACPQTWNECKELRQIFEGCFRNAEEAEADLVGATAGWGVLGWGKSLRNRYRGWGDCGEIVASPLVFVLQKNAVQVDN